MKRYYGVKSILLVCLLLPLFSYSADQHSSEFLISQSKNKHFTIYYKQKHLPLVSRLISEADFFYERVCSELGLDKNHLSIELFLDPSGVSNNEVFPVPQWVGGYYSPGHKRIVLKNTSLAGRNLENELLHVFRHEAIHAAIDLNGCHIPRWFNEGLAVFYTRGFSFTDGRNLLRLNTSELKKAMKEQSFNNGTTAPISYSLACGLVSYMMSQNKGQVRELLKKSRSEPFDLSFSSSFGISFSLFLEMFKSDFLSQFTLWQLLISEEALFVMISLLAFYLIIKKRIKDKKRLEELEDVPEFPDYWNVIIHQDETDQR